MAPQSLQNNLKTIAPQRNDSDLPSICAKLVTVNQGRREAVVLKLNKPVTIGRNPRCDYVIAGTFVSAVHCTLSAIKSPNGGVIVSCQPENILLHAPGHYPRILIADFGLARPKAYQETLNVCGTVSYLPPEGILALDQKHLKYVGGTHPFDNESTFDSSSDWLSHIQDSHVPDGSQSQNYIRNENRLKAKIIDGDMDFHPRPWNHLPDAKALVGSLLIHNPRRRATVNDALQSSWIECELGDLNITYRNQVLASAAAE
ncbi:hypothetical protein B0H10DRAFT_2210519 [Mycena sp. CBHHK59/15]|nr:hypothetical protein B0H10DRAFT_2210519 [Mycena sp. CBHHK59/15]